MCRELVLPRGALRSYKLTLIMSQAKQIYCQIFFKSATQAAARLYQKLRPKNLNPDHPVLVGKLPQAKFQSFHNTIYVAVPLPAIIHEHMVMEIGRARA